jgi:hypothetical protein
VFQWLRTWVWIAESVYWIFTIISSYTLKITETIAHVTSHTNSSNSSAGNTAVPLEIWNSSEYIFHSRVLSYPLGTDNAQKTVLLLRRADLHTENKSRDNCFASLLARQCCLATRYKHSPYCCVTLSEKVFIAPLPSYTRYNINMSVVPNFEVGATPTSCNRPIWYLNIVKF